MKTVTISLTEAECKELAELLDIAVRSAGLRVVPNTVKFIDKMNLAIASSVPYNLDILSNEKA